MDKLVSSNLDIPDIVYRNPPTRLLSDIVWFNSTTKLDPVPYVGLLATVDGTEYKRKGATNPTISYMNNNVKIYLKLLLRNPVRLLRLNKEVNDFNEFFDKCFQRAFKSNYLCKASFQFGMMLEVFFRDVGIKEAERTAFNVAQIIEFDDRYRYTLQDLATEVDIQAMTRNPHKELKRLLTVYKTREIEYVYNKIKKLLKPIFWLLLIPKYKRAFVKSCVYLKGMALDEDDIYWTCTKGDTDYHYCGLTWEQRLNGRSLPQAYTVKDGQVIKYDKYF